MRRVAVLLNRNARSVTPRMVRWVEERLPGDVFVSATVEEARASAAAIVERGYRALCVGGGDGTFIQTALDLLALAPARLPAMLPLRLGTGNAICDVCGSSPPTPAGLAADLERAAGDEQPVPLKLLDVDGRVTYFAGVGVDARYHEDFRSLIKERWIGRGFLAPAARNVPGFLLTALISTVPKLLARPRIAVRILNAGGPAHLLDADGAPTGESIPDGAVVHEGEVAIAAVATISEYSNGLTFFPFVDSIFNRFQLRVSAIGPLAVLGNARSVMAGTYRNPARLWDYAATSLRFELPAPEAFHIGGDVQPRTRGFTVTLSPHTIPLLRRPPAAAPPAPAA